MYAIKMENSTASILFSPGHPSGNDYKNFEERGDHFKELVQEIYGN
jgi:UDP-N-acetylmuramoylalanine-D-glutamate ligase